MIISRPSEKTTLRSDVLWDWVNDVPMKSQAQARPYVGDFFEEATAKLMDGFRLKTDAGAEICPDILLRDGWYVECKSVGLSNTSVMYDHRILKYDRFIREGNKLLYAFWRHKASCAAVTSRNDLWKMLSENTTGVVVVPAWIVHKALWAAPQRHTCYSGTKGDPGKYYKMAARNLSNKFFKQFERVDRLPFGVTIYGHSIPTVEVFGYDFLERGS